MNLMHGKVVMEQRPLGVRPTLLTLELYISTCPKRNLKAAGLLGQCLAFSFITPEALYLRFSYLGF